MLKNALLFLVALVSVMAASGACAQRSLTDPQRRERHQAIKQEVVKYFGTYQCGGERVTIDASWYPNDAYDGIHYHVAKDYKAPDSSRRGEIIFAFPNYSRGTSSPGDFVLTNHIISYIGDRPADSENWSWNCTKVN